MCGTVDQFDLQVEALCSPRCNSSQECWTINIRGIGTQSVIHDVDELQEGDFSKMVLETDAAK